jgi:hypothetical protein
VLNNRLNTFSDEFLLLNENQTGFRKKIWCSFSEIKVKGQKTCFTQKIIENQISIRISL